MVESRTENSRQKRRSVASVAFVAVSSVNARPAPFEPFDPEFWLDLSGERAAHMASGEGVPQRIGVGCRRPGAAALEPIERQSGA
jgi:hypothetical protein